LCKGQSRWPVPLCVVDPAFACICLVLLESCCSREEASFPSLSGRYFRRSATHIRCIRTGTITIIIAISGNMFQVANSDCTDHTCSSHRDGAAAHRVYCAGAVVSGIEVGMAPRIALIAFTTCMFVTAWAAAAAAFIC